MNKQRRLKSIILSLILCVMVSFTGLNPAMAGGPDDVMPPVPLESNWSVMIAPYGWLFGINGHVTVNDRTAQIDSTPIDTLKNFSDIDFIGELHLEVGKGPWAFMFDPTYLKISKSAMVNDNSATLGTTLTLIDFGVFRSVKTWMIYHDLHSIVFQLFAGGRYLKLTADITVNETQAKGRQSFIVPILGGRLLIQLADQVNLWVRGDFGGFGIDHTHNTWSASAVMDYVFNKTFALAWGFRVLGVDYSRQMLQRYFAMKTIYYGPELGLIIRF